MKRLILIILVLVIVAGGGAAGLIMLGVVRNPLKPPPTAAEVATAAAQAAAEADAQAHAFKAPTEALPMVKVADLIVPVIERGEVKRRLYVNFRLVTTTGTKGKVGEDLSRYQDALLTDLVPYYQRYFQDHEMIDIAVLKRKLTRHAKEVFGDDIVEVLMVNVFESGAKSAANSRLNEARDE